MAGVCYEQVGVPEEAAMLRRCLGDLVSIVSLPSLWQDLPREHAISTLLDALLRMLHLDFAYVSIAAGDRETEFEVLSGLASQDGTTARVGAELRRGLGNAPAGSPRSLPNPLGPGEVHTVALRLGVLEGLGTLIVASRRPEFPNKLEQLLVQVAANQLAMALQDAGRRNQQLRTAQELERRVAERTRELVQANEELRREIANREASEREQLKLVSLIEHSSDFIGVASLDGAVLFVNAAGRRLVGLRTEDDVRTRNVGEFVVCHQREQVEALVAHHARLEGGWYGELQFRHFETDATIPMLLHIFLIRDPETHAPVALATISRDISDRRRAEEALRVAKDELARVGRVLTMGELVGSIAHEVNQPLSAVVSNAGACVRWLDANPPNVAEAREAAACIKQQGKRASEVIQRIRALLVGGEPKRSPVRLDDTIREAVRLIEAEAGAQAVSVTTTMERDLPPVLGDRVQLQQVILNLLLNAIEAMKTIGDRSRLLEISAERHGTEHVRVRVRDTGTGVPAIDRPRVFDAFYTTKAQGMGMGLAICRSIVEAHGGRIWATANEDSGETLQFTCPTSPAEAP